MPDSTTAIALYAAALALGGLCLVFFVLAIKRTLARQQDVVSTMLERYDYRLAEFAQTLSDALNQTLPARITAAISGTPPTESASALESPDLDVTPQFQTFLDVMTSPHSMTTPPSKVGAGYQQAMGDYWNKYQQGNGGDLTDGLKGVDKAINDSLALVDGP